MSSTLDELAGSAGERFGDEERLRQEALDPARAGDDQLVLVAELLHAEDGDDVAEVLVALQRLLHFARHLVVLVTDRVGGEHLRRRLERVDRRVDAQLGDLRGRG